MIITRSWIQEWVDISSVDTKTLLDRLNSIGFEVAEYKKLNIPKKVVVGKVVECRKHPDADRLSICMVDIGRDVKQIVCGAKNVAKGQFVPVAIVGAKLGEDFEIKPAKLRGVESEGMICSSTEIGLPALEDGIMVLDESIGELILGKELREYEILSDEIIDIELTANRGDCLSIYGISREIAAAFDLSLKSLEDVTFEKKERVQLGIGRLLHLKHEECDANLLYKVFKNDSFSSPLIVRFRLALVEESFRNRLEELAFYTTYSVGVIIRCYDYSVFKNEKEALIEIKRDENGMDAVFDSKKLSVIGVCQSEDSKPKSGSEYFIAEASYIDPELLSRRFYEASKKGEIEKDWVYYRSSRGSNPQLYMGMDYFCYLVRKYSDIEIFSGTHEILNDEEEKSLNINVDNLSSLIGQEITNNQIVKILSKLGFSVIKSEKQNIVVKVPSFRHDIANEQDIAEECVRFIGIDNIEPKPFLIEEKNRINDSLIEYRNKKSIRYLSVAAGFFETTSYIFAERKILQNLGLETIEPDLDLQNPITSEMDTLRTSMVPGLLKQCSENFRNGIKSIRLFEIGKVFDRKRNEKVAATYIFCGGAEPERVSNQGKPALVDFEEFVKRLSAIFGDFELIPSQAATKLEHPYICAYMVMKKRRFGKLYKLHPNVADMFNLPECYVCEIDFDQIDFGGKEAKEYSVYQVAFRDLSILIEKNLGYENVKEAFEGCLPEQIKRFYPVDIFSDEKLGDKKSLTIRFAVQSDTKTLSEEEISSVMGEILAILQDKIGAVLR